MEARTTVGKSILVLFVLSVLLMTGCSSSESGEGNNLDYHTGSEGLVMAFMDNMPPQYIYEGDKLDLGISLKNKGTNPLENGRLFIEGYDRSIISPYGVGPGGPLPDRNGYTFGIGESRGPYNDIGGEEYVEFSSGEITLPQSTPRYPFTLTVYACYEYTTDVTATICLDPNPHRTNIDKPCTTQDVSLGSQGAPVAVTSVEVDSMGENQARLVFTIKNIGTGDVVSTDNINSCPGDLTPSMMNQVLFVSGDFVGNGGGALNCMTDGQIRLGSGNSGKIVCTAPIEAQASSYVKSVHLELRYGYRQFIKKQVEIRES